MTIIEVKEIPKRRTAKHNLVDFLEEFMKSDIRSAKIEYDSYDYSSYKSCYANMHRAAKQHGFPIKVLLRSENVYLVKL
jgi:hypothetical protein